MNLFKLFCFILMSGCTTIEVTEPESVFLPDSTSSDTSLVKNIYSSEKEQNLLLESDGIQTFVFHNFPLYNIPMAEFHSLIFYIYNGEENNYYSVGHLRMGYNEIFQGSIDSSKLWLIQYSDLGYGYAIPYTNDFDLVSMHLIYVSGYCYNVEIGQDNRKLIPHFWGYNPIDKIEIKIIKRN